MDERLVTDWDAAYANARYIPGGDAWPEAWASSARKFREDQVAAGRAKLDLAYGPRPRNRFDIFLPARRPDGLVVFVHGGYWLNFDKSYWSHLAAGSLENGFAVAIPSYTLCPEIRIGGIVNEIAAAVSAAAAMVEGQLTLSGHSAGGHLVTRLACTATPLPPEISERIRRVVSISGVHDLRPLIQTAMNERLHLDEGEARAESPALLRPLGGIRVTCWVGANERPEFLRQNALLANMWAGLGAATSEVVEPGRHHFDVINGLAEASHALMQALC